MPKVEFRQDEVTHKLTPFTDDVAQDWTCDHCDAAYPLHDPRNGEPHMIAFVSRTDAEGVTFFSVSVDGRKPLDEDWFRISFSWNRNHCIATELGPEVRQMDGKRFLFNW